MSRFGSHCPLLSVLDDIQAPAGCFPALRAELKSHNGPCGLKSPNYEVSGPHQNTRARSSALEEQDLSHRFA